MCCVSRTYAIDDYVAQWTKSAKRFFNAFLVDIRLERSDINATKPIESRSCFGLFLNARKHLLQLYWRSTGCQQ
jgi:hypothetical protein